MSKYRDLQEIFLDQIEVSQYIGLDTSILFYNKLLESIAKPLKMILLYGRPGTGKSVLLNKVYHDLKERDDIFMLATPVEEEREFLGRLYRFLTGVQDIPDNLTFTGFLEICNGIRQKRHITVLLDEAQLYPPALMEKIRLISDTRAIKFVVSLHKTEKEDLIAKEHFQSRIWETIELKNGTVNDIEVYVQKKLNQRNYFDVANMFTMKNFELIHRLTGGNYREVNKLIFTLFEIYEYYDTHRPSKISQRHIKNQFIEMAALKLGYIHA